MPRIESTPGRAGGDPAFRAYGDLLRFAAAFTQDFSAIVPQDWLPGLLPIVADPDAERTLRAPKRIACVRTGAPVRPGRTAPGVDVRFLSASPVWLAIGDRRAAFVSPTSRGAFHGGWTTTDPEGVRTAKGVFELVWCGARPKVPVALEATERREAILLWLAKGLTDSAIAKRLNVTDRTVRREISSLMRDSGATSRFQLGLRAALGGLPVQALTRAQQESTESAEGTEVRV
ncbi:helix-turn-helix domain-containing protein [Nocardiopsis composta]|uniref:DNA-binding CsgD family transcriptional regulator n=1 Tax=Nocardiopsis composta TaxID=157465 RepID=A0A7W8VCU5_9ACTN|nr:helix-turn-helix transcriptional regulator [Nocardiopsis composta]MBB5431577.1 DNA-binding CsgD family transcriptional regulator [Nocardiopsis composta]